MLQHRGWQVMWLLLALGCAGELRDPGRFSFVLNDDGGMKTERDSGDKPQPEAGKAGGAEAGKSGGAASDAGAQTLDPAPECVTKIFASTCTSSVACHASGAAQVDLKSPGVERRLVGVSSSASGQCADRTLVATDGSDSLLLQKLEDPAPCGSTMPIGPSLSEDQVACLTDWVKSLAGDK